MPKATLIIEKFGALDIAEEAAKIDVKTIKELQKALLEATADCKDGPYEKPSPKLEKETEAEKMSHLPAFDHDLTEPKKEAPADDDTMLEPELSTEDLF